MVSIPNILQITALPRPVWGVYKYSFKDADLTDPSSYWTEELFLVGVVQRQDSHPFPDGEIFSIAELLHSDDCGTFEPVSESRNFVNWFKTEEEAQACISVLIKEAEKKKEHSNGKMVAQQ